MWVALDQQKQSKFINLDHVISIELEWDNDSRYNNIAFQMSTGETIYVSDSSLSSEECERKMSNIRSLLSLTNNIKTFS